MPLIEDVLKRIEDPVVRTRALENLYAAIEFRRKTVGEATIRRDMDQNLGYFRNVDRVSIALDYGFQWDHTPEGGAYWRDINNGFRGENN